MRLACSAPYLVLLLLRFTALIVLAQWMRRLGNATAALRYAAGGGGSDGGGSSRKSLLLGDDAATTATDGGAVACDGEEGATAPRLAHAATPASDGGGERDRGGLDRVQTLGVMRARAADLARTDASVFTRALNPVYDTEVRTYGRVAARRAANRTSRGRPSLLPRLQTSSFRVVAAVRVCRPDTWRISSPPTVAPPCRSAACARSDCPPTMR